MEDWRYGPLGRTGLVGAKTDSGKGVAAGVCSFGTPDTGLEDWRYGPLGRAGLANNMRNSRKANEAIPAPSGRSLEEQSTDSVRTASVAADGGGIDVLAERFRLTHNLPSTPARSLSREVRGRTIWGYWAQGFDEMPELFKLCVGTWRWFNPHWDVRILCNSTLHEFLSETELPNRFSEFSRPQIASNCVRLALLARYGGVWLDASVILRTGLDGLCWEEIACGQMVAAALHHERYGTGALGCNDFVESWLLATRKGNPFFLRWRDLVCELLHNRLDVHGLRSHPLCQDLDLMGFERLGSEFRGSAHDQEFREHLAHLVMFHRLLQRDPAAQKQWRESWRLFDAESTALCLQQLAYKAQVTTTDVLRSRDGRLDDALRGVPLVKLATPHYSPLLRLPREELLDETTLLGRFLRPPLPASHASAGHRRPVVGAHRVASFGGSSFARAFGSAQAVTPRVGARANVAIPAAAAAAGLHHLARRFFPKARSALWTPPYESRP